MLQLAMRDGQTRISNRHQWNTGLGRGECSRVKFTISLLTRPGTTCRFTGFLISSRLLDGTLVQLSSLLAW
jgi:hypothetical protein